jgi:hypothetical protein
VRLDPDKYQVFLFTCPATVPLMFARHPWFVVNRKGKVSRWEVFFIPAKTATSWGHLARDFYEPFQGISIVFSSQKYLWKSIRLVGRVEGGEDSNAHRMTEFIESSPRSYPYCPRYSFFGPNSNTYAQWVLNSFPEAGLKLPGNSFGKGWQGR